MPLSRYGLCDALSTTARSKPWRSSSSGAPGVGRTPPSSAWPPAAATPAASAASSISPDSRVSRTIRTWGACAGLVAAAARPSASARSAVRNSPATPRTPSVPNSLPTAPLALGELRALARLLEAGLLALLDASVARQEAAALELGAQGRVGLDQRAGDAVAERSRLGGHAAAVDPGHDVHAALVAGGLERAAGRALQAQAREEVLQRTPVDEVRAAAGLQDHAGDRGLALAGRAVAGVGGQVEHAALGLRRGC